jgi:RND family efflux transporter MFP subunit
MRVLVLAMMVAGAGCAAPGAPRQPPPAAAIAGPTVDRVSAPGEHDDAELLGVVVAPQTVDVTAELDGRLTGVCVVPGDSVAKGDVLARLDLRNARRELRMARAELSSAEAERDRLAIEVTAAAERVARRESVIELDDHRSVGAVSAEELSTARYQHRSAVAKLSSAGAVVAEKRAHLEQIALLLDEGLLRAPFDGAVVRRYADDGAAVRKGAPVVRVVERGRLKVRFAVPEDHATGVVVGATVRIATGGRVLDGVVEKVSSEIDVASRMIFAEASLPSADAAQLRSGLVARLRVAATAPPKEP